MKGRLFPIALLLVSAGPAAAQVAPGRAPVCGAECFDVVRTGVAWLLEDQAYAPADVALDTALSGLVGAGSDERRVVDASILARVASVVGVRQDSNARAMVCTEQRLETRCRLRGMRVLMVVYPPRPMDRADAFELQVMLMGNLHEDIPHGFRIFQLTVERARNAWTVTERRLIGMS